MATKYTPQTSQTLLQPQGSNGIDEMINIVQGMIEQRRSSEDRKWIQGQRERNLLKQEEEDVAAMNLKNTQALATDMATSGRPYTSQQAGYLLSSGQLPKDTAMALQTGASDYVPESKRLLQFADQLQSLKTVADVMRLADSTGVERTDALALWNEHQQINKPEAGSGGSGDGSGKGAKPPTPTQVNTAQDNINDATRALNEFSQGSVIYKVGEGKKAKNITIVATGLKTEGKTRRAVKANYDGKTYAYDGKSYWL